MEGFSFDKEAFLSKGLIFTLEALCVEDLRDFGKSARAGGRGARTVSSVPPNEGKAIGAFVNEAFEGSLAWFLLRLAGLSRRGRVSDGGGIEF